MKSERETYQPIPEKDKKRATSAERDSIIGLFQVMDILHYASPQDERTVKRIKNGLRDYRLISKKLENLCRDVLMTIPIEQMRQIRRQMEATHLAQVRKGDVLKKDDTLWVMEVGDIIKLITMATHGACMLCSGDKKGCELSRMIDELPIEVKDGFLIACKGGI